MLDIDEILSSLDDTVIVMDNNKNIIHSNKDYKQFIDLISNKYNGEIYITESDKWYNITSKKVLKKDKNYSIYIIKNITKYKQKERLLEKERVSDGLTGLYNRKGIEDNINNAIEIFKESKQPFTIIIGDIDYFKKINDTYCHLAGDMVLRKIGEILSESLRKDDFVGRYGGEEFMIVLKNDKLNQIIPRINQIKQKIEQFIFKYDNNIIKVTMTFGIQIYDGTKDIEKVVEEADLALCYGKENGRNQINVYNDIKDLIETKKKKR